MLEPEAAYAHLEDMMALGEGLVSHVVQSVVKNRARELETVGRDPGETCELSKLRFRESPTTKRIEILQKTRKYRKVGRRLRRRRGNDSF